MPRLFIVNRSSLIVFVILLFLLTIFHLRYTIYPKDSFAQSSSTVIASDREAISKTDSTATPLNDKEKSPNSQLPTPNSYEALPSHVDPQSPVYSNLMIYNFMHGLSCIGVGQSPIGPCIEYQMQKDLQGKLQSVPVLSSVNTSGGVLGSVGSVLTALYTYKPINSGEFFLGMGRDLGIVSEAHAQVGGSGNGVLSPIFELWQVSRNFAYIAMIVIFLVIGFMVMFRNRVNPQTVITVQAAIPGLIIGLIMITFSYFMASLISDLAFLGTDLVGYYFVSAQPPLVAGKTSPCPNPAILTDCVKDKSVLKIFAPFTRTVSWGSVKSALDNIWGDLGDPNYDQKLARFDPLFMDPQKALWLISTVLFTQLLLPFGSLGGGPWQIITSGVAITLTTVSTTGVISATLSFIAMIILIYSMFKLLLRLINNFLSIIFLTISAPFQFLFASLPGRQGIFTDWVRNMLCNVLAFPAVIAVLYFVAFLIGENDWSQFLVTNKANLTANAAFPLLGGLDLKFINLLLVFGALVATPTIPDIICRAIGKVGQAGQLIGQELSGGVAQGRQYAGQFQSGVGGMTERIGDLRDRPGYVLDAGNRWQRVTTSNTQGLTDIQVVQSGAAPGTAAKIGAWLRR